MSKNPRRKPGDILADLLGDDDEDSKGKTNLAKGQVPKSSVNVGNSSSDVSEADAEEIARQLEDMDDMEANLFGSKKPNKMTEKKKDARIQDTKDSKEKAESVPSAVIKPKKIKFDDFDEDDPLAGLLSDEDDEENENKKLSTKNEKMDDIKVADGSSTNESSRSPSKEIVSILKKPPRKDNVDFDGDHDLLDGLGLQDSPTVERKKNIKEEPTKDSNSKKNKSFLDTLLGKTETSEPIVKKTSKSNEISFGGYMPTFGTSQTSSRRQSSTDELKEWLKEADSLPTSSQKDSLTSNTNAEYTDNSKSNVAGNQSEIERAKPRTTRRNDDWLGKEDNQHSAVINNPLEKATVERRRQRPKPDWFDADNTSAFADSTPTLDVDSRKSGHQEIKTNKSVQKQSSGDWLGIDDSLVSSADILGNTVPNRRSASFVETSLKGSPLDEPLQPKSTSTPIDRSAQNDTVRTHNSGQAESMISQRGPAEGQFASQLKLSEFPNASVTSLQSSVDSRLLAGYNSADIRKTISAGEVISSFNSSNIDQRPSNQFPNMGEASSKQFLQPKPAESRSLGEISNYDVSAHSSSSFLPPMQNMCPNCVYLATSGKLNSLNNLEFKVGQLEIEKTELKEAQKKMQTHHTQEVELLKEAYKYHVKQLEEALESKGLRLKSEINNLEQEIQNKNQKWEKEKKSILDTHEQQIESLRKEWSKEVEEMKSLYKQSISELKQNQSLLTDRMKFLQGLGEMSTTSLPNMPIQNSAFQPLLDHITRQNEELQRMKERINDYKQNGKGEQEIRFHLLNEQIKQQQSAADIERNQMKQLILHLEEQLHRQISSTEGPDKIELQRQKLLEEQIQMKQYLVQGLAELERAKMKFNEDREILLKQLREEMNIEATKRIPNELDTENTEEIQKQKVENELQAVVAELVNKENYLQQLQEELKFQSQKINHEWISLEEFRKKLELDRDEIKLLARQVQIQLERAEDMEMSARSIEEKGLSALELSKKMEEEQQSRIHALQQQVNTVRSKEQHLIQDQKYLTQEWLALKKLKSSYVCPSCSVPMVFAGGGTFPPSTSISLPHLNLPSSNVTSNVNINEHQSISEPVLNQLLSDLPSSSDIMLLLNTPKPAKLYTLNPSARTLNTTKYTEAVSDTPLPSNYDQPPTTSFEANILSYKMAAERDRQDLAEEKYFLQSITNS